MAARQLHHTFSRLAMAWPKDPLRPNAQMGRAIQAFADETFLATPASASKLPDPQPPLPDVAAAPERDYKQLSAADEGAARAALEALQAIHEGTASKQLPTPDKILRPASNKDYYSRLAATIDRAAAGQDVSPSFGERFRLFLGGRR